jgi:predicted nucleotidyltransferase
MIPADEEEDDMTEAPLPEATNEALQNFVGAARASLGDDLRSIVLFGSAAEGRLRATSDVNVIVVLARFEQPNIDALREPLRRAYALARVTPMFLLESEVPAAVKAFTVKFADVLRRRKVLHGSDPFEGVKVPRDAEIARLKQVLLNLMLRLRHRYVLTSLRDEQAMAAVADAAGPLRACAAALLELRGKSAPHPKEALEEVASKVGGDWRETLENISKARESRTLPPGAGATTLLRVIELVSLLRVEVDALEGEP